MRDGSADRIPAAIPATAFALGIAAAPRLLDPWGAAVGIALCAGLLALGRAARRGAPPFRRPPGAQEKPLHGGQTSGTTPGREAVTAAISFAAGLAVAAAADARRARDLTLIASLERDQFVRVEMPLDRGWEHRGETATLRARSFGLAGETVELPLYLTLWDEPPPGSSRATTLLAEGFLFCDGEGCRMNVKSARLVRLEGELAAWHPARWNRAAFARIEALGKRSARARRGAAQAAALALGRGELLDEEVREAYRRGGTYHLLVFSGMQIALAAGVLSWAFRRFGRPRPADWVLLAIAIVAPPFAGHDPSVARASVMIGSYAASRILRRPTPPANLLFVSALLRLAASPWELGDPGFALTWGASGGLLLVGGAFAARCHHASTRALAFGIGAELGTAPITALYFHQVVLASSVVTLVLSPLLSVMVGVSALACASAFLAPRFALVLLESIGRLDALAVSANLTIANATGIARIVAAPQQLLVAAAFALAIVAIRVSPRRGAAIAAVLLLLPLAASSWIERTRRSVTEFSMTVIDVGQGEAILLRHGAEAVLVDGGGRRHDPTFGRRVVVPWLIDRGVRRPAVVVMTHADPDHCGGLVPVVELLGAGEVWLSSRHVKEPCAARLLDAARARRVPVRLVDRYPPRRAGSLPVRTFAAEPPFRRSFANNTSLVVSVAVQRRTFLLTGDIERAAELRMIEALPSRLACDVLKVAHHGSRSSTSESFLRLARPRLAAVSCGRENGYGHPAPEVVSRLAADGIRVYRTDLDGTTTFSVAGGRLFARREIDTPGGTGTLVAGGRKEPFGRTMSSIFIRLGLYGILVMLAVFVAGQTFSLPYAQYLTSAHLGQVGLACLALIAVGFVFRLGETVRRKTKKGKGRCIICKRPVLVGDKYCREHLRQMIGDEQERVRSIPPQR